MAFETALEEIYNTIGCDSVKVKPDLCYKMSTAAKNVASISLSTEEDWDGLLEEVEIAQRKKNAAVAVNITITEQVSNKSIIISLYFQC